jgi:hypothetical protein
MCNKYEENKRNAMEKGLEEVTFPTLSKWVQGACMISSMPRTSCGGS